MVLFSLILLFPIPFEFGSHSFITRFLLRQCVTNFGDCGIAGLKARFALQYSFLQPVKAFWFRSAINAIVGLMVEAWLKMFFLPLFWSFFNGTVNISILWETAGGTSETKITGFFQ